MTVLSSTDAVTPPFSLVRGFEAKVTVITAGFNGRAWLQRKIGNQWQNELDASFGQTYTISQVGEWRGYLQNRISGSVDIAFEAVSLNPDIGGLDSLKVGGFNLGKTGTRARSLEDKLRDMPSLLDFTGADPTGVTDQSAVFAAALAANSGNVYVPPGTYLVSTPIAYIENTNIYGPAWNMTENGPTAVINAPTGFLANANTTRKRISVRNLKVVGPGTGTGVVGINGPFGGRIEQVLFDQLGKGIVNASSYLSRYVRCSFYNMQIGISLADANGCKVEDCYSDSRCGVFVDMLTETPQTGNNNGYPIVIRGNNSNVATLTGGNQVVYRLRGLFKLVDNYMEDFSGAGPSGNEFVHVEVNRFDNCAFEISGNEINGQSNANCAVRVYGSHSLECRANGVITRNRWLGMLGGDVMGGSVANPTFNNISYLRIFDNSAGTVVSGFNAVAKYRPMATLGYDNAPSIAGATLLQMPISGNVLFDNASMSLTNQGRARKAGTYAIEGAIEVQSTAASYTVTYELRREAVVLYSGTHTLAFGANPTRNTIVIPRFYADFAVNEDLTLWMANGETSPKGVLSMEWVGDGYQ